MKNFLVNNLGFNLDNLKLPKKVNFNLDANQEYYDTNNQDNLLTKQSKTPLQTVVQKINKNKNIIETPLVALLINLTGKSEQEIKEAINRNSAGTDSLDLEGLQNLITSEKIRWSNGALCGSEKSVKHTFNQAIESLAQLNKKADTREVTETDYQASCDAVRDYESSLKTMIDKTLASVDNIQLNGAKTDEINPEMLSLLSSVGAFERLEKCYPTPFNAETHLGDPLRAVENQKFIADNGEKITAANEKIQELFEELSGAVETGTITKETIKAALNIKPPFSANHRDQLKECMNTTVQEKGQKDPVIQLRYLAG
jgi:hypothetical protein